jgi:hypothetical protein
MVPDNQLQSATCWAGNSAFSIVSTTGFDVDSVGQAFYQHAGGSGAVVYDSLPMPVRPGDVFTASYQITRSGGTTMAAGADIRWYQKDGTTPISSVEVGFDTTGAGAVLARAKKITAPAGARIARFRWRVDRSANDANVRFFSPSLIRRNNASVLITPDGAFMEELVAVEAWIGTANIKTANIVTAHIENGAVSNAQAGFLTSSIAVPDDGTFRELCSATIFKAANQIAWLFASATPITARTYEYRLRRGTTTIWTGNMRPFAADLSAASGSLAYSLQVRNPGPGSVNFDDATLGVIQLKR